jgi:hypothetical protein
MKKKKEHANRCVPYKERATTAATFGDGICVGPSKVGEDAGHGLFATRNFRKGEIITEYDGDIVDRKTAIAMKQHGQMSHLRKLGTGRLVISGLRFPSPGRGGGSFANHDAENANAGFKTCSGDGIHGVERGGDNLHLGRISFGMTYAPPGGDDLAREFLVATRDIQAGQEITLKYNPSYFDQQRDYANAPGVPKAEFGGKQHLYNRIYTWLFRIEPASSRRQEKWLYTQGNIAQFTFSHSYALAKSREFGTTAYRSMLRCALSRALRDEVDVETLYGKLYTTKKIAWHHATHSPYTTAVVSFSPAQWRSLAEDRLKHDFVVRTSDIYFT